MQTRASVLPPSRFTILSVDVIAKRQHEKESRHANCDEGTFSKRRPVSS